MTTQQERTDIPSQKVPEVEKFTMRFVLDVDYTPAVLRTPNSFPFDNHIALRPDNDKRNHFLMK